MNPKLLEQLQKITPEEQSYLDGAKIVQKEIYTSAGTEEISGKQSRLFEIDAQLFLQKGKLITVRRHSRFVDFPAHRHNYIEILYVCAGTVTHYIEGKELVMQQGDLLLLNQHVEHSVRRAEYGDIGINFIALPEFFDIPFHMIKKQNVIADFLVGTLRQNNPLPQYLLFQLQSEKRIANLMENMISSLLNKEVQEEEDSINQYSMGLVFLYLLSHMDKLTQNSSQNYQDIVIQSTLKYIDVQYKTANLSQIAQDFHQSLPVLSKLIKKSTGSTFQELLMRKRFQKAVAFLVETELPVEEIAATVGYENLSYFYRQFKARYGMTPSRYRTLHKHDAKIKI